MSDIVPNQQNLIIYNTLDGKVSVTMMARDGNVWMNQKQMAELFATSVPNVNIHISNILKENELDKDSVIKDYLITDTMKQNMGYYSATALRERDLGLDSVVKFFFTTTEKISGVRKEGQQMKEMSVCKESLLTVSTCAELAQVQLRGKKIVN
jgi:hypothetical protein